MDIKYLIIQFIGLLGTGLYFASFQFKDNKRLFTVQIFSYLFYTTHLFLLGAITGGLSYILNLARSVFLASDRDILRGRGACIILCLLQLAVCGITWSGPVSLFPVAANIASTIGGYSHNARKIRIAGMFFNSPLWIVYDILVGSWAGIVDELASEASMIFSVIRFGWNNLDEVND